MTLEPSGDIWTRTGGGGGYVVSLQDQAQCPGIIASNRSTVGHTRVVKCKMFDCPTILKLKILPNATLPRTTNIYDRPMLVVQVIIKEGGQKWNQKI